MNLKEAFRYQNKIDQFIGSALGVLARPANITTVNNTYLRSKAVNGAEDETVTDVPSFEHYEHITDLTAFLDDLLTEKTKLYAAIKEAKLAADIDIDTETTMNSIRQKIATTLRTMCTLKSKEETIQNGGSGYCMNNEGNQVSYRCDVRRVTTINFDRKAVQSELKRLDKKADETSTKIDQTIIMAKVNYQPTFDINDTFEDAFENYLNNK